MMRSITLYFSDTFFIPGISFAQWPSDVNKVILVIRSRPYFSSVHINSPLDMIDNLTVTNKS